MIAMMKKISCSLAAIVLFTAAASAQLQTGENVAVTNSNAGKVRGYINNGVYTYKGIPYAVAKRFEAPQKPAPWQGVRSSMTYGPVAPLMTPTTSVQDEGEFVFHHDWGYTNEDCMRLNVWTPGINDGKKRPVLFWIHGGGFAAGSSQELPSYDGESLAKKGDVVVVSINHRLNILGFLDLSAYSEKYKHSANVSMLDIKAALEWVRDNIANFGGDAGNVTIFGQSGGGAKVNTLMAMPSAKGLFHKALNESGSFRTTMLNKETTQAITAELLQSLNLSPSQADSLQTIPYADLVKYGNKALAAAEKKLRAAGKTLPAFGLGWGPSVDGEDLPYDLFSKEAFELSKDVPLMIGTTKNEFTPFMNGAYTNASAEKINELIKAQRKDKADAYIAAVKKAYPADTKPSDLIDIDLTFRPGAVYQAEQKAALKAAPVFVYLFTWQSPVMDGKYKAVHCMDIPFFFNNIQRCAEMTGGQKDAYALADKMSSSLINFARTGNPNAKGLPNWPAYDAAKSPTMHLNNVCEVKPQLDKDLFELTKQ